MNSAVKKFWLIPASIAAFLAGCATSASRLLPQQSVAASVAGGAMVSPTDAAANFRGALASAGRDADVTGIVQTIDASNPSEYRNIVASLNRSSHTNEELSELQNELLRLTPEAVVEIANNEGPTIGQSKLWLRYIDVLETELKARHQKESGLAAQLDVDTARAGRPVGGDGYSAAKMNDPAAQEAYQQALDDRGSLRDAELESIAVEHLETSAAAGLAVRLKRITAVEDANALRSLIQSSVQDPHSKERLLNALPSPSAQIQNGPPNLR